MHPVMVLGSNLRRGAIGVGCRAAVVALLASVSAGCGPDLETVIAKHRPQIEAKFRAYPAIVEQLRALPPLQSDGLLPGIKPEPPLVVHADDSTNPGINSALVYAEDMLIPEELGNVPERVFGRPFLNDCAAYLRYGTEAFDPSIEKVLSIPMGSTASPVLERCARIDTLLVLRTDKFAPTGKPQKDASEFAPDPSLCDAPTVPAGTRESTPRSGYTLMSDGKSVALSSDPYTFEGGILAGEVLIFRVADGRYEGGFRVEARNSPKMELRNLDIDLMVNLSLQIKRKIAEHIPGAHVVE